MRGIDFLSIFVSYHTSYFIIGAHLHDRRNVFTIFSYAQRQMVSYQYTSKSKLGLSRAFFRHRGFADLGYDE